MNLREFYDAIEGDYSSVMSRLQREEFVKKFVLKFLQDDSYDKLCTSMQNRDVETAFRAAHTLKGICLNLSFVKLCNCSSELTEILRAGEMPTDDTLLLTVQEQYKIVIEAIKKLV